MKFKRGKKIPFDFVLAELADLDPLVKPMFGAYGVYVRGKIVIILRERPKSPEDNGIWIATTSEHHASLKKDFPLMRSIQLFGPGETGWQVLPADHEEFEAAAFKLCELVLKGDDRIGKVPKVRSRK